jgi:hypothetical protein
MNHSERLESLRTVLLVFLALLFCEGGCSLFVRSDGGLTVDANATCGNGTTFQSDTLHAAALATGLAYSIPERTIAVDGQGSDWNGTEPVILDATGDSLCVPDIDLVRLYLARDHDAVYWRLDTEGAVPATAVIVFSDMEHDALQQGVRHEVAVPGQESVLSTAVREEDWDEEGTGPGYAAVGEVIEGRIPLHLFRSRVYGLVSVGLADEHPTTCDEAARQGELVMW